MTCGLLAGLLPALFTLEQAAAQDGTSGLPIPRFVSLRADEVNMRTGPGVRYPIDWVYARQGLPVQVIGEFEAWRQIRDSEGSTGWVHRTMLSGRRTASKMSCSGLQNSQAKPAATAANTARPNHGLRRRAGAARAVLSILSPWTSMP